MRHVIQAVVLFAMVALIIAAPKKPVTCKSFEEGYDYLGYKDCKHLADTWEGCAKSCTNHDPCFYWSWNMDTNACCWMQRKNFEGKTKNPIMVSGNWAPCLVT